MVKFFVLELSMGRYVEMNMRSWEFWRWRVSWKWRLGVEVVREVAASSEG